MHQLLRSEGLLWDVVAAADARQHAAAGDVRAAKAAGMQRAQAVRELVEESHALLCNLLRLRSPALFADDAYAYLTDVVRPPALHCCVNRCS